MNVRKPSNEHLQANKYPNLESFFMDPKSTAQLLQRAVNEGVIEAQDLEAALQPFVEQARFGLERGQKEQQDQYELQKDIIMTHLFTKLVNFTGGIANLKEILEPFCKNNQLLLEPKPGIAVIAGPGSNIKPDWISKDGLLALRITHSKITIYTKIRSGWVPYNQ